MSEEALVTNTEEKVETTEPVVKTDESKEVVNDWRTGISEENMIDDIKNFKSLDDMSKSYKNLKGMIGKDKIVKPGENATEEEINEFQIKALGRPETLDGYKFDIEGVMAEDKLNEYKEYAFKNGFSNEMANKGLEFIKTQQEEANVKLEKIAKDRLLNAENNLRKEYGENYDNQVSKVQQSVTKYADTETVELLNQEITIGDKKIVLGNHPGIIKMIAGMANDLSPDSTYGQGKGDMTPSAAKQEIAALEKSEAYTQNGHIEHREAVKRMRELVEIAG